MKKLICWCKKPSISPSWSEHLHTHTRLRNINSFRVFSMRYASVPIHFLLRTVPFIKFYNCTYHGFLPSVNIEDGAVILNKLLNKSPFKTYIIRGTSLIVEYWRNKQLHHWKSTFHVTSTITKIYRERLPRLRTIKSHRRIRILCIEKLCLTIVKIAAQLKIEIVS